MSEPKILYLEDTQKFADVFMRFFPDVDVTHVSTFSGFQKALLDHDFEIVVSDVNVPMRFGESPIDLSSEVFFEVARSTGQVMPVVFITSAPTQVDDELDVEVFDKIDTADWKQHLEAVIANQQ